MKKFWKIFRKIFLYGLIFFFGSTVLTVLFYSFINPPVTPLMVIRCTVQLFSGEKVILKKEWVSIEKVSPDFLLAIVAAEDNRFIEHNGFDFEAIRKASDYNKRHEGKKIRGGSTISQQVAKNVFLWPQRSWLRKGMEFYFTFLIELVWSKKRILEVYLNVVELGNGIYGVEKASEIYFKRPAGQLTRSQAAMLAAVLPNPRKWDPAHPTRYLQKRQSWILWNMNNIGKVNY